MISWWVGSAPRPQGAGQWGATRPASASWRPVGRGWASEPARAPRARRGSSVGRQSEVHVGQRYRLAPARAGSSAVRGARRTLGRARPARHEGAGLDRTGRGSRREQWNFADVWEAVADALPDAPP